MALLHAINLSGATQSLPEYKPAFAALCRVQVQFVQSCEATSTNLVVL